MASETQQITPEQTAENLTLINSWLDTLRPADRALALRFIMAVRAGHARANRILDDSPDGISLLTLARQMFQARG